MISLLMALVPFFPEVLKLFRTRQDNRHELAMMDKQAELERLKIEGDFKARQLDAQTQEVLMGIQAQLADMVSAREVYQKTPSFGVQLLDKAHAINMRSWVWVPVFWAFSLLDFVRGAVVPGIAISIVALYISTKYAAIEAFVVEGQSTAQAVANTYTTTDFEILTAVVSFYLGNRLRKAVFGGSADNNASGK